MSDHSDSMPAGALPCLSRRRSLGWLVAGSALTLSACTPSQPIRIGFIGGLSGRVADLGVAGRNGAQLAIDDLNAAGGIRGRRLELVAKDDEQNPELAPLRLKELADSGIELVIGPMTSSIAVLLVPLANAAALTLISPTVTTDELSGKADHFFRAVPNATSSGAQEAGYLHGLGLRKLVMVADQKNKAYTDSWAQGARQRFVELGGVVQPVVVYDSSPGLSYDSLAQRILQAGGDVVMLIASAADSAVLMQQLRRRDPQIQLATAAWAGTEQLLQMGGRAVEGAVVPQYFDRDSQEASFRRFSNAYHQRFGQAPGFPAVNAYDAMMLGALALQQQRPGQALQAAVASLRSLPGLQRPLLLDEFGDSPAPLFLTRVQDRRYVLVNH
jgi:branched-chain amino acid transport system substrate-binding protein